MHVPVKKIQWEWATKQRQVCLTRDLPLNHGFGNKHLVPADTPYGNLKGYITSNGFEGGLLKVEFWHSQNGTERVQFNPLSAGEYLGIPF